MGIRELTGQLQALLAPELEEFRAEAPNPGVLDILPKS